MATTYGVLCDSVLNTCKYFHITSGMVPDIMHIILEGSLELCMHHLLIYLVREKKLFSLDQLNDHTTGITYGLSEVKNKPTEIAPASLTSDGHLKQSGIHVYTCVIYMYGDIIVLLATATQMWCLGRFLPLLIGHHVPEGDCFWENFLLLLTIMDCFHQLQLLTRPTM